jgi:hypothetical protein
MTVFGVVWWRWPLFALYLAVVGLVLVVGVQLVIAHKVAAFGVFLAWLAACLAWPHRWYLRGLLRRA